MDRELLRLLCEKQKAGIKVALVSVVATRGSTPRKAGSEMLVLPDGQSIGTIGGGCGEAEVRRQALSALDASQSGSYTVTMLNDAAADEGMVCGGVMEVFIKVF